MTIKYLVAAVSPSAARGNHNVIQSNAYHAHCCIITCLVMISIDTCSRSEVCVPNCLLCVTQNIVGNVLFLHS